MNVDYALQTQLFFFSALLGASLSVIYDLLRFVRFTGARGNAAVFVQDVLYCVFSALAYVLLIYNYSFGAPRLYAFVGVAAGWLACHFTAGKLVMYVLLRLRGFIMPRLTRLRLRVYGARQASYVRRSLRKGAFFRKGC